MKITKTSYSSGVYYKEAISNATRSHTVQVLVLLCTGTQRLRVQVRVWVLVPVAIIVRVPVPVRSRMETYTVWGDCRDTSTSTSTRTPSHKRSNSLRSHSVRTVHEQVYRTIRVVRIAMIQVLVLLLHEDADLIAVITPYKDLLQYSTVYEDWSRRDILNAKPYSTALYTKIAYLPYEDAIERRDYAAATVCRRDRPYEQAWYTKTNATQSVKVKCTVSYWFPSYGNYKQVKRETRSNLQTIYSSWYELRRCCIRRHCVQRSRERNTSTSTVQYSTVLWYYTGEPPIMHFLILAPLDMVVTN